MNYPDIFHEFLIIHADKHGVNHTYMYIRKSTDYVYGIWVCKVLGIWKGYYRVKKSLVSCMKPWTEARNKKYMKYLSKLTYQLSFWNARRKVDYHAGGKHISLSSLWHIMSIIFSYDIITVTSHIDMTTLAKIVMSITGGGGFLYVYIYIYILDIHHTLVV